jgi:serine/threonine protein kinase
MGRVFTITEGLENMGALRTGGQGSVYKGRRIGEIITAVKLLPTPIHTESTDDKNFRDFQNEVEKLKKVNENPNPNVVKILSSGITESGSLPFIEMEFIEGPDLEELLKPPHEPVFPIRELIRVADQLSNALAHCHKVAVKHGDIKSNNVKLNIHTGNYVLLDFGLAAMSDEQRRTSLRHAGAIEFMAPEQNEGVMLFQTDVYSFGVILYELVAGTVPFPLRDKGETARNTVMVAHMETPVPDVMALRKQNLPASWNEEKKRREMQVPSWILNVLARCLEKSTDKRFPNGMELHNFISHNSILSMRGEEEMPGSLETAQSENGRLRRLILEYQEAIGKREQEIERLGQVVTEKDTELVELRNAPQNKKGISTVLFTVVFLLMLGLAGFAGYTLFLGKGHTSETEPTLTDTNSISPDSAEVPKKPNVLTNHPRNNPAQNSRMPSRKDSIVDRANDTGDYQESDSSSNNAGSDGGAIRRYKVIDRAYFHNEPDEATRRNAFIVSWNNAVLNPIEERDGYIYVIYTNASGQTSKGWLNKKDLRALE